MKIRFIVLLLLIFVCVQNPVVAKELKPFECMHSYVEKNWSGSHKEQANVFNAERDRLGDSFVPELLLFIDGNIRSHYWISIFITDDYYLNGHKPLLELGLLIMEQGLVLCENKEEHIGTSVSMHVIAAILAKKLGLNAIALSHKNKAETIIIKDPIYAGAWPVLDDNDRAIYDSI